MLISGTANKSRGPCYPICCSISWEMIQPSVVKKLNVRSYHSKKEISDNAAIVNEKTKFILILHIHKFTSDYLLFKTDSKYNYNHTGLTETFIILFSRVVFSSICTILRLFDYLL